MKMPLCFVVKPFYQSSWDGDKGSADDFLNGEIEWNTRHRFRCLLPAMHPVPPLLLSIIMIPPPHTHFSPLLMAGNTVYPVHRQLDMRHAILSMKSFQTPYICDKPLVHLRLI